MEFSFASALHSPTITYEYGHDSNKKRVTVQSGFVSHFSKRLANDMAGEWLEKTQAVKRLDDVDVETFERFLEFVFTLGYTDPKPEEWGRDKQEELDAKVAAIETENALAEDVSEVYPEQARYDGEELIFDAAPVSCSRRSKCSKRAKKETSSSGSVDSTPNAESEGYTGWCSNRNSHSQQSQKSLAAQAFSERTYAWKERPAATWAPPQNVNKLNISPVLIGHATLYAFADKYDVPDLKNLVLHKLHGILQSYRADYVNLLAILDLIRFVFYQETTPTLESTVEPLRGLIVHYVVTQLDVVKSEPLFKELLEQGDQFVSLLWSTVDRVYLQKYLDG